MGIHRFLASLVVCVSCMAMPGVLMGQEVPVSVQVHQEAWTLAEVGGDRLEVRLVVSNQGAQVAENILLVLPSGWESVVASRAATVRGGVAVWPLGSLEPGDSAEVELSVPAALGEVLAPTRAHMVVGGQAVVLSGRAVRLLGEDVPGDFLGITPDADPTDPPVVHQAALLGYDPAQMLRFVQRQIAHQPYRGSLHGARGALYGRGGNAHDKANLLVAMLRAGGVPAAYRFGALDDAGLDRLAGTFFPPAEATDRAGRPLTVEVLRAHPESILELMTLEAKAGLGETFQDKIAAVSAMDDAALEALLFEQGLDEAHRGALREHAWVEAWIEGRWVSMDPSFVDAAVGEVVVDGEGERVRAMPEDRRHKVLVRVVRERFQPVFGAGRPERQAPALELERGAGDLVGRSILGAVDTNRSLQQGFFFFVLTNTYSPSLDIRDLERPGQVQREQGEPWRELSSNFVGPLVADYTTGAWIEVELLEPGQARGRGEVYPVTLGDRFPAAVRFGAPFSGQQDFTSAMIDSMDATAILVGAAHVPPRVTQLAQTVLAVQGEAMQARLEEMSRLDPSLGLGAEDYVQARAVMGSAAEVMLLLHDSNAGERARLLAQTWRQRLYHDAPRVRAATHRALDPQGALALDLLRERVEGVGAPGQLRRDRQLLRAAYGSMVTGLEGEITEAMAPEGAAVISTERVMAAAIEAGVEMVLLIGADGLARLDAGLLEISEEAEARMRLALGRGATILTPRSAVPVGEDLRVAWMEFEPDGAVLGRLDNGAGGSAVEYALFLFSVFCTFFGDLPACQTPVGRSFFTNLGSFTGRLFGLISGAVQAVSLCAGGSQQVCRKLGSPGFQQAINNQISLAFLNLTGFGPMGSGSCTVPLLVVNGVLLEVECLSCGLTTLLVEGICHAITALAEANNAVLSAAIDPILSARLYGILDGQVESPEDLHTVAQSVELGASLPRVAVSGRVQVRHARLEGDLSLTWAGEDQCALGRQMEASRPSLEGLGRGPASGLEASWRGVDQSIAWSGADRAALSGQGTLDLYAGLLPEALSTAGGWSGYALEAQGPDVQVTLDTRPDAAGFAQAGLLSLDDAPQVADLYTVSCPEGARLEGGFAGPLGAGAVTIDVRRGGLSLTDAQGVLNVGGRVAPVLAGQSFGGATGQIALTPGAERDSLDIDLEGAHQVRLVAPERVSSSGRFEVPVQVQTSLAGEFRLSASAPQGWRLSWEGATLVAVAGPDVPPQGSAPLRLLARGPEGLFAAAAVELVLARPEDPQVSLSLVEDLRHAVEIEGVRATSWIVEVGHLGQQEGRYLISAEISDPRLRAELTGDSVLIEPGGLRRLGLTVGPSSPGGPWPGPEEPLRLTLRASGDAEAEITRAFSLPAMSHLRVEVAPDQIALNPGERLEVPVRVTALGNVPTLPRIALGVPPALSAVLSPPSGPLSPGQSETLTLSLGALALGPDARLPSLHNLTLTPSPTPFEVERQLDPAQARLSVTLTDPAAEDLVLLLIRAASEGDLGLAERVGALIRALEQARVDCDPVAIEALAEEMEALVSALESRFGASETTRTLAARAEAARAEGCAGLDDELLALEGIEALRRGPDLQATLRAPREQVFGAEVNLTAQITNLGDAPSIATQARLQFGPPGAPARLHTETVPVLNPGERAEFEVTWAADMALGSHSATLIADPEGAVGEFDTTNNRASVAIQILPGGAEPDTNRPPAFLGSPPARLSAGFDLSYDPQVVDPDGDPILVEVLTRPAGLRLNGAILEGRVHRPGTYEVALVAVDRYGAAATQRFELVVTLDAGPNLPPVITSRPGRRLLALSPWSYALEGFDPEGDALTWSLVEAPEGAELAEDDTLTWTPGPDQLGTAWFEVLVQDARGAQGVQRFAVEVRESPLGPDLSTFAIDMGRTVDDQRRRSGIAAVSIANLGDLAAPASALVLYEERDGVPGPGFEDAIFGRAQTPSLEPGQSASVDVVVEGPVAFEGNVLWATADADLEIEEQNEDNNHRFSGQVLEPAVHPLVGYVPEEARLILLSPDEPAAFRLFDPITGAIADEGVLEAGVPREASMLLGDALVEHVVVESDVPVQAYLIREIFEPDFGGDFFHPSLGGSKVGREFALMAPTLTPNNRLVVVAVEAADITLEGVGGEVLERLDLGAGQAWEPDGLVQGAVYRLRSSGDLVVQSSSVTGYSVVPPAEAALAEVGDVGQGFYFSIRSRGPGGGAVAVMGHEAADYVIETSEGRALVSGSVQKDGVSFHTNLGEHLGLSLRSSAPVAVMAGDMARPGADGIEQMGEDFSQHAGTGGVSLLVHSQSQIVGDTVLLTGPLGASVTINGEPRAVEPYGIVRLDDGAIYRISASSPVVVQSMGGGDRHFDMGDALRRLLPADLAPRAVLSGVEIDAGACARRVLARGRLGNAGNAPIPGSARVELIELGVQGERVLAEQTLGGRALEPGAFVDLSFEVESAPGPESRAWALRAVGVGEGLDVVSGGQPGGDLQRGRCLNRPPRFTSQPAEVVAEGERFIYAALAEDPEGQAVTYALLAGPPGASVDATVGRLTWLAGGAPRARFVLRAADPEGAFDVQTFEVAVEAAELQPCVADADSDGFCAEGGDCDDARAEINPGQQEILGDGLDNDCSGGTPDALAQGAAELRLQVSAPVYGPGGPVNLLAFVGNPSRLRPLAGVELEVEVACVDRPSEHLRAPVPTLGPSSGQTLTLIWRPDASIRGRCQAHGRLMAGPALLAEDSAPFEILAALLGAISASPESVQAGEAVELTLTVFNPLSTAQSADLSLRLDGRREPLDARALSLEPEATERFTVSLDTAPLAPSVYALALFEGEALIAQGLFRVRGEAALDAPEVEALDGGDLSEASPVVLRPLGPRPGAPASGGSIRAAWTPEALLVEIRALDETPEVEDAIELRVATDQGEPLLAALWIGDAAVEAAEGVEASGVLVQGGERVVTARLSPSALVGAQALEEGQIVRARILLRDGSVEQPRDAWVWATDIGFDEDVDLYGAIQLTEGQREPEPEPGEPEPEPGEPEPEPGEPESEPGEPEPEAPEIPGTPAVPDGGCDCSTSGSPASGGAWGWIIMMALIAGVREARRKGAWVWVLAILGATACDDPELGVVDGVPDAAQEDRDTGGGFEPEPSVEDVGVDVGGDAGVDVAEPEPEVAEPEPEVVVEPEGPVLADVGQECVVDGDCASGICMQGVEGAVCTQSCDVYACPEAWVCERFPGGARLCVPARDCLDADEDSYGRGRGCLGPDCDDGDALINPASAEACDGEDNDCNGLADEGLLNACGRCGEVPEELCDGLDNDCDDEVDEGLLDACGLCEPSPFEEICNGLDDDCDGAIDEGACAPGECTPGEERPCYGGPPQTQGQGTCQEGTQVCSQGIWGECEGDTPPSDEACDGEDNDCDGERDEGLINRCGSCGPAPQELCNGLDDDCDGLEDEGVQSRCGGCAPCGEVQLFPGEVGQQDPALAPAPDGALTLGSGQLERHFLWVPNSDENTISRWDTRTGLEEARFWIGENPSRTAVDLEGNVWVGNRGDGRATHIFTDTRDCIDRNGDGVIQTSRDFNGDGRITAGEMVGTAQDPLLDECVHCQVRVGQANDLVRGVAVDADGFAWLGTWNSREIYKVNPENCEIEAQISTAVPGRSAISVYGLAVDGAGNLWTASLSHNCVARVDTQRAEVIEQVCATGFNSYGIAVDAADRVWWGDISNGVWFYDPIDRTLNHAVDPANRVRSATGIVAGTDGMIYVAAYDSNLVGKLDPELGVWRYLPVDQVPTGMIPQRNPRGVTIDDDGNLWAICRGSSGLVKMTTEGEILGTFPIVGAERPDRGTGPYSYSDNTGFQLFNFTVRSGSWRHVFDAGAPVRFVRLTWSPFIAEGTRIDVQVRAADDEAGLEAAQFSTPSALTDVDLAPLTPERARLLEMVFTLSADDPLQRPVLRDIQVFFETADCREVPCPEGQQCNARNGGCVVLPRECRVDEACLDSEHCDPGGFCRPGCRIDPGNCGVGERCDPRGRFCTARAAECAIDLQCPDGAYCTESGFCEPGCRLDPDTCPTRTVCEPEGRQCAPQAPECVQDEDCPEGRFCKAGGVCLGGCRLDPDDCGEGARCEAETRLCEALPPDCDPGRVTAEVCDGLDNDCDGVVDEEIVEVGVTCAVGDAASGFRVCAQGRLMCRAEASSEPQTPTRLVGRLDRALLPEGFYEMPANTTYTGPIRIEPGALLLGGQGTQNVQLRAAFGAQGFEALGAVFDRVLPSASGGLVHIEDTLIEGHPGAQSANVELYSAALLRDSTFRNLTIQGYNTAPTTIERCRLESNDSRTRWQAILRAPSTVIDNHVSGLNIVPRVHDGIWMGDRAVGSTLARNRVERLVTAVNTDLAGAITVSDNTLAQNDAAVRVSRNAFPRIEGNFIDMADPGHVGEGVVFDTLLPGGGAEVRDNRLRMGFGDAAFRLDPDVFQIQTPSIFEGNTLQAQDRDQQVRIAGVLDGGAALIGPTEGISRLVTSNHVYLDLTQATSIAEGMIIANINPSLDYRWLIRRGAVIQGADLRFEDIGLNIEAGTSATLSDVDMILNVNQNRYMINLDGALTLSQSRISNTFLTQGNRRQGRGVHMDSAGRLVAQDVTLEGFEYGLVVARTSTSSLQNLRFENNAYGLYVGNQAVVDPASNSSFIDADPLLLSTGVHLALERGGRGAFAGTFFDIGAEDTPWLIDLDAFQDESRTTLSGTTYANGVQGLGTLLRGNITSGSATLSPLEGDGPLVLGETLYVEDGAQINLDQGQVLQGPGTVVVRRTNTRFNATGATLRNLTLGVYESAVVDLEGVTFENTDTRSRTNLDVIATALLTDCVFLGFERRQNGIEARVGGQVLMDGGWIEDMDYGLQAHSAGHAEVQGVTFQGSNRNLYLTSANSSLIAQGCTIQSGDPNHNSIGIEVRGSAAGMSLQATDLHFDLEPGDVPYRFELGTLRDGNVIDLQGSTFQDEAAGPSSYQIYGDIRDLNVALPRLEPAQQAFEVIGDMRTYGAASLTLNAGVRLTSAISIRLIEPRDTSRLETNGASLHNVRLAWRNSSSGQVLATAFTADVRSQYTCVAIGDTATVDVRQSTFTRLGDVANDLWGVHVFGTGALRPTIEGNTFTSLRYGIALDAGHQPSLVDNTFQNCVQNIFQR